MTAISIFIALGAGFISFASPCCLPLVPVYVSYMVGANPSRSRGARRAALRQSLVFVLGFSVVFVVMWASVGLVGYALRDYAGLLRVVGGAALIVMGLHVAGLIQISALYRDVRLPMNRLLGPPAPRAGGRAAVATGGDPGAGDSAAGDSTTTTLTEEATPAGGDGSGASYGRSALLGVAFAAGWTPCIGPILGAIIALATQSESVGAGTALLVAYAAGLGVPFVLVAVGAGELRDRLGWFRRHNTAVSIATGAMLGLVGFLMITNLFARLSGMLPSLGI